MHLFNEQAELLLRTSPTSHAALYDAAMAGDILIRQLEYLVALAREKHFGRAATACHASQPALSTGLRRLEAELGVTIVQRGRRFSGFTPEGDRVVGWAHRILAERDALRTDLDRMRHGLTATLRIGAIPTAIAVMPLLTEAFRQRHPVARIRIEVLTSREIVRRLTDFDLDVGLTYLDEEPESAHAHRLYEERYYLLTPGHTDLMDAEFAGWATATELPLCALNGAMQNRRILDARVAAAGAQLTPEVETDTIDALYAHLASGHWSSIIAHTWLHAFGVPPGMHAIPMAEPYPHPQVGVITSPDQPTSILANALLDAVRAIDVDTTLDDAAQALATHQPPTNHTTTRND
jgi:DNA-binding transcriptional LysR family regulator